MSKNNVIELAGREAGNDPLTELLNYGDSLLNTLFMPSYVHGSITSSCYSWLSTSRNPAWQSSCADIF